jgi:hypothetical protein
MEKEGPGFLFQLQSMTRCGSPTVFWTVSNSNDVDDARDGLRDNVSVSSPFLCSYLRLVILSHQVETGFPRPRDVKLEEESVVTVLYK